MLVIEEQVLDALDESPLQNLNTKGDLSSVRRLAVRRKQSQRASALRVKADTRVECVTKMSQRVIPAEFCA
jgi:hypothetical protein